MNLNLAELEEKKKHVLSIQWNTYRQVQGGGGSGLGAGRQGKQKCAFSASAILSAQWRVSYKQV